ncbi:ZIP family metal transporter [Evansella cellulosilytica]|uniref:Zinc/iron permease n=1 Tax=Evansella cellulosilytica (strain ATCC 21833 / DSM 2522 / FERM P-1141 / JCM 9156 / N-4) TaxID=649639 RepID=E6TT41_EVAC2|nr:ZIP family metal transporter [Evansella cellulosilytica]ADU31949.1 zinc/iron permease [Evansella cellulosilytica DSM 2522]
MWNAIFWGTFAASATLLGALVVLKFSIPKKVIAFIMALGTGALIGATAYELLEDGSLEISSIKEVAIGFLGGALIFTVLDMLISKKGGHKRKHSDRSEHKKEINEKQTSTSAFTSTSAKVAGGTSGVSIFIGTVMDTLPESAMIGMSLIGGESVSLALVVSIFISNIPEGLSSTAGLLKGGFSKKRILFLWLLVVFFSALSSLAGAVLLEMASDSIKAIVSSFAGGAIIAMIASTMMPEAYKEGGPIVGFITAVGLFLSLWLHHL